MKSQETRSALNRIWHRSVDWLGASIGTKIILPYFLLTLVVAAVGAYIVVDLVTGSLRERFNNQLIDAGRVVSEAMVDYELERLEVLRTVVNTIGVPANLAAGDKEELAALVPQIIANSDMGIVVLVDKQGREVFGWQRPPGRTGDVGEERSGSDFADAIEVRQVLDGYVDDFGENRVYLGETPYGLMLFTVGPVYQGDELVGAAMVGMYVREMVNSLAQRAVARVTLYTPEGQVVETTLGGGQEGMSDILVESPEQYETILALLREAPERHPVVISKAEEEIYLRQHEVLGQEYILAFGDWRVRGQSLGFFSVALPSNFIFNTALTSRNMLSLVFSLATIAVFGLGFIIARRIVQPLHRLVETSIAVARGDLTQRTGIERADEIGSLAHSFDIMTDRLENRNRQLVEQASKLEAILNSTADGIIVIDRQGSIITINPAAQKILFNVSSNFLPNLLKDLPSTFFLDSEDDENANQALELARLQQPRRYQVDNYFLSSLVAPVRTPSGEELGIVIALRDITREAEAEQLKDSFITNISHELRTPLTAIKGYSDLLLMTPNDDFNENQLKFMQSINENAGTMIHHINELIDISQVQSGLLKLEEDNVNLPELVEEVAEHWREKIESKGLSLEVKLPEEELWVYGDFKRLTWVVDNLLSNAYSYTLQDGRVEVRLFRAGDEVRLDVTDTGVGVAVVDQPYLFTRFFRANNQLTFDVEGVGLGLFIVRSVVELHGGRVWAESEVGSGSTFSLALPLLETEAVENG